MYIFNQVSGSLMTCKHQNSFKHNEIQTILHFQEERKIVLFCCVFYSRRLGKNTALEVINWISSIKSKKNLQKLLKKKKNVMPFWLEQEFCPSVKHRMCLLCFF